MTNILIFAQRSSTEPTPLAITYRKIAQARPIVQGKTFAHIWWARWRLRQMLRHELLLQPDSVLEDAGLERRDAEREAAKPFWKA
ncbi:MAG: hypothetical protein AAF234_15650 [Pseudomonadota bacterium]